MNPIEKNKTTIRVKKRRLTIPAGINIDYKDSDEDDNPMDVVCSDE